MGFMMGGGGGGGFGPPPGARPGMGPGQAPGLPFAGIPPEYAGLVEALLADEPEVGEIPVDFSHVARERGRFTLKRFLAPHWHRILLGILLVAVETVALQAGPLLTKIGIDKGLIRKNFGWVVTAALLYLGTIVVS